MLLWKLAEYYKGMVPALDPAKDVKNADPNKHGGSWEPWMQVTFGLNCDNQHYFTMFNGTANYIFDIVMSMMNVYVSTDIYKSYLFYGYELR